MHRSCSFAAFAALSCIGLATTAMAADQKASFESLDKNSDGKVSLNEATVNDPLFVAFKSLDSDKDGELTKEEFARYEGAKN